MSSGNRKTFPLLNTGLDNGKQNKECNSRRLLSKSIYKGQLNDLKIKTESVTKLSFQYNQHYTGNITIIGLKSLHFEEHCKHYELTMMIGKLTFNVDKD